MKWTQSRCVATTTADAAASHSNNADLRPFFVNKRWWCRSSLMAPSTNLYLLANQLNENPTHAVYGSVLVINAFFCSFIPYTVRCNHHFNGVCVCVSFCQSFFLVSNIKPEIVLPSRFTFRPNKWCRACVCVCRCSYSMTMLIAFFAPIFYVHSRYVRTRISNNSIMISFSPFLPSCYYARTSVQLFLFFSFFHHLSFSSGAFVHHSCVYKICRFETNMKSKNMQTIGCDNENEQMKRCQEMVARTKRTKSEFYIYTYRQKKSRRNCDWLHTMTYMFQWHDTNMVVFWNKIPTVICMQYYISVCVCMRCTASLAGKKGSFHAIDKLPTKWIDRHDDVLPSDNNGNI